MNTYIIARWRDGSTGVFAEAHVDFHSVTPPKIKIVGTYSAPSWEDAMQMWYDYKGFGTYVPMKP
jgi:hypothetical protein